MRDRRPRDWYRIANVADGPARVDIYDEIGAGDPWSGRGVSAADFVLDLAGIDGDVEVHINSPGGNVFDGLAIYNAIAQRPGDVTTVVDGLAASAASFIAQAGRTRVIAPGAMMMIHDAQALCIGNEADMRETAGLLAKASGNIAGIYAAHSGRMAWDWRQQMQAETWYTAQEAVDAGLADRIAERPAAAATVQAAAAWARDLRAEARRILGMETTPLLAKALPVHHTATAGTPWDGPAAVAAMPAKASVLQYCHAWQDSTSVDSDSDDGDDDADDKKSAYKFPHHATKGGPANLAACRNGLARLSGADIPDGDRAGVKAHLQAHLDDAGHDGTSDQAGLPAWLQNDPAGPPAWLTALTAKEAARQ